MDFEQKIEDLIAEIHTTTVKRANTASDRVQDLAPFGHRSERVKRAEALHRFNVKRAFPKVTGLELESWVDFAPLIPKLEMDESIRASLQSSADAVGVARAQQASSTLIIAVLDASLEEMAATLRSLEWQRAMGALFPPFVTTLDLGRSGSE